MDPYGVSCRTAGGFYYYSDEVEPIWVNDYCSVHDILLVGEGDFSFSLSLATSFGWASNMVATSLDTTDDLMKKYGQARSNVEKLKRLGATVLHGVDATKMKFHPDLKMRRFDRIIFNFPHAGFYGKEDQLHLIKLHKNLVQQFFFNACRILRPDGEIHVNHKTSGPYRKWKIEELAANCSLALTECVVFNKGDYPGYNNKRGDGSRCDEPFHIGESSTYKFAIRDPHKEKKISNFSTSFTTYGNPVEQVLETFSNSARILVSKYGSHNYSYQPSQEMCVPIGAHDQLIGAGFIMREHQTTYRAGLMATYRKSDDQMLETLSASPRILVSKYGSHNYSYPANEEMPVLIGPHDQFIRPDPVMRENAVTAPVRLPQPESFNLGDRVRHHEILLRRGYKLIQGVETFLRSGYDRKWRQ